MGEPAKQRTLREILRTYRLGDIRQVEADLLAWRDRAVQAARRQIIDLLRARQAKYEPLDIDTSASARWDELDDAIEAITTLRDKEPGHE